MTIPSWLNDWIVSWTKTFEQGPPAVPAQPTKSLDEFLIFLEGFPYAQVAGAVLAQGTNVPLDITAGMAILTDINKAFFSGHTVQTATMAVAAKIGVPSVMTAQIIFDPVHPVDPTQFSRGR